jgi:hypothetical protein
MMNKNMLFPVLASLLIGTGCPKMAAHFSPVAAKVGPVTVTISGSQNLPGQAWWTQPPGIYLIKNTNSATGTTEMHILNGADNFQSWLLQTGTAMWPAGDNNGVNFGVADYNNDGIPDLYCILRQNTGTQSAEVHVLGGASGYQTWSLQTGTVLTPEGDTYGVTMALAAR